jgi:hypothetical protein
VHGFFVGVTGVSARWKRGEMGPSGGNEPEFEFGAKMGFWAFWFVYVVKYTLCDVRVLTMKVTYYTALLWLGMAINF